MKAKKLINPHGQVVKLYGSNRQIALITGLSQSSVESLMVGRRVCIKGWISCHPKAKKRMKEILDHFQLHNIETGEVAYTWNRSEEFQEQHNIPYSACWKIRRSKPVHRKWINKKTYDLLYGNPIKL